MEAIISNPPIDPIDRFQCYRVCEQTKYDGKFVNLHTKYMLIPAESFSTSPKQENSYLLLPLLLSLCLLLSMTKFAIQTNNVNRRMWRWEKQLVDTAGNPMS